MHDENHCRLFEKEMDALGRRFDLPRLFDDFLTVAMCCVHQTNIATRLAGKDPENEALYLSTIKPYSREELDRFARLLAHLQMHVHQQPYGDLLGEYFTEHITHGRNGQYFTPPSLSTLMGQLVSGEAPPVGKRIYDPACGSGRLLLEFARTAPANYFHGNDVSLTCAKMTSLNFFFNGLRGEAACMDTLTMEWVTGWKINAPMPGIVLVEKEASSIWSAPPVAPAKPQQLALFQDWRAMKRP